MAILDRQLRAKWEQAGFDVEHEVISSVYHPMHDPERWYPMGEVKFSCRPRTLIDAVAAIRFVEREQTEVWIHKEMGIDPCWKS